MGVTFHGRLIATFINLLAARKHIGALSAQYCVQAAFCFFQMRFNHLDEKIRPVEES